MCRRSPACLILFGLLACFGCDPAAYEPPPSSAELPTALPSSSDLEFTRATGIVLVLPREVSNDLDILEQTCRAEAGLVRTPLSAWRPVVGDPPSRQADLVRQAAKGGASALIVVAEDPDSLAPALVEVRDKGVPIMLLGKPVPIEGKAIPVIESPPYSESAKALVAAAVKEAKVFGFPAEGPAVILINAQTDRGTASRVAALEAALEEAGVALLDRVKFGEASGSPTAGDAQTVVEAMARSRPGIAIILADEDQGVSGAVAARDSLKDKGQYSVAGFARDPRTANLVSIHACAAVVNLNLVGTGRQAVRNAIRMIKGEPVAERTVVNSITKSEPQPRPMRAPMH